MPTFRSTWNVGLCPCSLGCKRLLKQFVLHCTRNWDPGADHVWVFLPHWHYVDKHMVDDVRDGPNWFQCTDDVRYCSKCLSASNTSVWNFHVTKNTERCPCITQRSPFVRSPRQFRLRQGPVERTIDGDLPCYGAGVENPTPHRPTPPTCRCQARVGEGRDHHDV